MERGGESWRGWHFGPYGRAKDWRLLSPDGGNFAPEEILDFRRMLLDLDYYQVRCKHLEQQTPPQILTRHQRAIIMAALQILMQLDGMGAANPLKSTLQLLK